MTDFLTKSGFCESPTKNKTSKVEPDGKLIACGRDPPGQRCVYIPPGNVEEESYRFVTYQQFPQHSPVDPRLLAASGFLYTGYKDRVKCFSCGQPVENWVIDDDPRSARWHLSNCEFIRGSDTRNIPMNKFASSRAVGGRSQRSVGYNTTAVPSTSRAERSRRAAQEVNDVRDSGVPRRLNPSYTNPNRQVHQSLIETFPCSNPVSPHMRNEAARLQTFRDRSDEWPAHRIAATPEQMARAGLYYLGEHDRVKCWYCNGGLQNWDRFDEPWFEHAKWFPTCEFVLRSKGPEFVANIVERFPNLNRPAPVNPAGPFASHLPQAAFGQRVTGTGDQTSASPQIIDPREERRALERRVDEEMNKSPFVSEAVVMGFTEENIRKAFLSRFLEQGSGFTSFASLVDTIVVLQEEGDASTSASALDPEDAPSTSSTSPPDSERKQNMSELLRLKRMSACKVCHKSKASVVFLPCGHLASCASCSKELRNCPLCQMIVKETVQSFIV